MLRTASACRSELAAATRQRLEEAARKKEEEAREKAAQRYTRTEYKCAAWPLNLRPPMPSCCLSVCSRLRSLHLWLSRLCHLECPAS